MKNKIRTLALAIAILFTAGNISAKEKIIVKKSGGGKDGYRNVEEKHVDNRYHSLTCSGGGKEACVWGQGIPNSDNQNLLAIDNTIIEQIGIGDYTGTGHLQGTNLWFYWKYDSSTDELIYTVSEDTPDYELE